MGTVHPSALGALRLAGHAVNLSHTIEQLSFGREFPGVINPLDGTSRALKSSDELVGATKYFVKVVPTTYLSSTSGTTESNQYSVTEFFPRRRNRWAVHQLAYRQSCGSMTSPPSP